MARVATELDNYIEQNRAGLIALDSVHRSRIGWTDPETQRRMEQFHALYPAFRTMAVIDMQGTSSRRQIRSAGQAGRAPVKNGRVNLSDRDSVQKTIATGRPFVSDVFLGREMGADPLVMLTMPIFDRTGAMVGIVGGSLTGCSRAFRRSS